MGRDTFIDWQLGTQSAFDEARLPGWSTDDLLCRRPGVAPLSAWSRHVAPYGQRTRVDDARNASARFKQLSNTEKLGVALRSTARSVGPEVGGKLQELISPTNLAIMAGALAIWVGAHATPIGWVVDIGMVGLGVVALGAEAIEVMRELHAFAMGVIKAQSEVDLIAAGQHLAKAIAIVGVDVVVAMLLKKAIVKVRQPTPRGGEAANDAKLFGKYDPQDAARSLPAERPVAVDTKATGAVTGNAAGKLTTADFPEIAMQISQKQLRHIAGRPEITNRGGGSYLNSSADAQAVLDAYHSGSATILGKSSQGFPVVRVEGITGTNVNVGAGFPSQPTNVFIIKGTASPSIVPTNPSWIPQ